MPGDESAVGAEAKTLPPAPRLDETDLPALAVLARLSAPPCFNATVGGRATRAVKSLLNVPLRLLGRPQQLFNRTVRQVLAVAFRSLRDALGYQAVLRDELTIQRGAIDALIAENTRLRTDLERMQRALAGRDRPEADAGRAGRIVDAAVGEER